MDLSQIVTTCEIEHAPDAIAKCDTFPQAPYYQLLHSVLERFAPHTNPNVHKLTLWERRYANGAV